MLQKMYKVYVLIHVIPHLLFKKDKFSKEALLKLARNILQTLTFFTVYAFFGKVVWCYLKNIYGTFDPTIGTLLAGCCASSIFIERRSRWTEFALNVFPRYIESLKPLLSKRKLWIEIPFLANMIFSFSMGSIAYVFFKDPDSIKKTFQSLAGLIFGPSDQRSEGKASSPVHKDSL